MFKKIILMLTLCLTFTLASEIKIENSYIRATPPNINNSAAFLTINNTSNKNITLLKVKSKISSHVEIHTSSMKNGMMSMYQIKELNIPAKSKVSLKPGSFHIMLIGLKDKTLKINDEYEFTLVFSDQKELKIIIPVKKIMHKMKMNHN